MSFSPEVLLALADEATLAFYASSLRSEGFTVVTTRPRLALTLARQRRPDVIVIDTSRERDAASCREFKGDPALRLVPVIALAPPGHGSPLDGACDAVLPVECLPHRLVEVIDRLLLNDARNR